MSETTVTVVGNVATAPVFRDTPGGQVARFRLASTTRYRDRATQAWTDGHTNFFTVWARWSLGANVAASLAVGEPVIVRGRLRVRADDRANPPRLGADIEAQIVGHDLSRGTAAFRRATRTGTGEPGGGGPGADGVEQGRAPAPADPWQTPRIETQVTAGADTGVDTGGETRTDTGTGTGARARTPASGGGDADGPPAGADAEIPIVPTEAESIVQGVRELQRAG